MGTYSTPIATLEREITGSRKRHSEAYPHSHSAVHAKMLNHSDRSHVAWDIETTGFGWSEKITISGFWFPAGHATLVVNTGPHSLEKQRSEEHLSELGSAPVEVIVTGSETEFLKQMRRIVFNRFDREYNRLIAYNADSWQGGFDLPFLRTRCIRQGINWVFDGLLFVDLWEPVKKRLNTTITAFGASAGANSLTGAYDLLFDQNERLDGVLDRVDDHSWYRESPYDPFEDSGSAAAHYQDGDLLPVCEHNLADVHRTWELGEVVREFVSPKDLTEKKLKAPNYPIVSNSPVITTKQTVLQCACDRKSARLKTLTTTIRRRQDSFRDREDQ